MSKYIPKVGEAFEWQMLNKWVVENKVVFDTDRQIAFIGSQGLIHTMSKQCMFRPIQTKSNVEREQLVDIIYKHTGECRAHSCSTADKIQQAGFTIPKRVKRSEIASIINKAHPLDISFTIDFICEVLGDLVEQDDIGGAE